MDEAEQQFKDSLQPQKLFTSFYYAANSWSKQRRVVCKAEYNQHGSNTRFILVSDESTTPDALYTDHYCLRGEMENKLKQMKLDLESDRMSCSSFIANQFRVLLSSLAYVLINSLREHGLKGSALEKAYCRTIRLKLFKIGAVITRNTRRICCYLSSCYPYQSLFTRVFEKLTAT